MRSEAASDEGETNEISAIEIEGERAGRDVGLPVRLSVGKDDPRARALYERRGFVVVGDADDEVRWEWVSASS